MLNELIFHLIRLCLFFSDATAHKVIIDNCLDRTAEEITSLSCFLTLLCTPLIPGFRSTSTVSSRRLLNKPLLIASHLVSCPTGSTPGALAPIALFCFTSSFKKTTMFVRICIFYRSLSQTEQNNVRGSHADTVCNYKGKYR